jgi:hypothetical protein
MNIIPVSAKGEWLALLELMSDPNTVLVDARFRRAARGRPHYCKSHLQHMFGDRYITIQVPDGPYKGKNALGNWNFQDHSKPVDIVDGRYGIAELQKIAAKKRVLLLCACALDYEICHRNKILSLLVA